MKTILLLLISGLFLFSSAFLQAEFNYTYHSRNGYFSDIIPFGDKFILVKTDSRTDVAGVNEIFVTDSLGNVVKSFQIASDDGTLRVEKGTVTPDNKLMLVGRSLQSTIILKVDTNGAILFSKTLNSVKRSGITPIIRTFDNNYIVSGADWYPSIAKIDENGNVLWNRIFGSTYSDVTDVFESRDSSIILIGKDINYGVYGSGDEVVPFIVKFSKDGELLWFRRIDDNKFEFALKIIETASGHFIMTLVSEGGNDYILKLDPQGLPLLKVETSINRPMPMFEDAQGIVHYLSQQTAHYFTTDSNLTVAHGYFIANNNRRYHFTDMLPNASNGFFLAGKAIDLPLQNPERAHPAFFAVNASGVPLCNASAFSDTLVSRTFTVHSISQNTNPDFLPPSSFPAYRFASDGFCQTACGNSCTCYGAITVQWSYVIRGDSVVFRDSSVNGVYYTWDFNDGTYSFERNPTHIYDSLLLRKVTLTVSNPCSIEKSLSKKIGQCPGGISLTTSKPSLKCLGDPIVLKPEPSAGRASFYRVNNGNWSWLAHDQPAFTITQPGVYRVTEAFADSSCILTAFAELSVDSQFFDSGYPDEITFCANDSVLLTVSGPHQGWNGPHVGFADSVYVKAFGMNHGGRYSLRAITPDGCRYFSDTIYVIPLWEDTLHWAYPSDTTLCYGETLQLTVDGGYNFLWSTGQTTNAINVNRSADYFVEFDSSNGCSYISDTISVTALGPNEGCNVGINNTDAQHLKIYPNPFTSSVTIETPLSQTPAHFTLFDIAGNQLIHITGIKQPLFTLQRNQLPQGIYFIEVRNGENTFRAKIIAL